MRGLLPTRFVQTLNVPFGVVIGIIRTPPREHVGAAGVIEVRELWRLLRLPVRRRARGFSRAGREADGSKADGGEFGHGESFGDPTSCVFGDPEGSPYFSGDPEGSPYRVALRAGFYPRQKSLPSTDPKTTRPAAMAGEALIGPPASNSCTLVPVAVSRT